MLSIISANSTAPQSSSLGIDKVFIGATLVLDDTKYEETVLPLSNTPLRKPFQRHLKNSETELWLNLF